MSRILLVDDSPHAQRMGERILSDEGYEVVTVSNADSALIRLDDVDPDVVLADTVMPGRTGFDICQYLKMSPRHRHVRVILTAGVLEPLDETQVQRVEADGTLKKPFEASALLGAVKPLAQAAADARSQLPGESSKRPGAGRSTVAAPPFVAVVDAEQIRAAITIALDASMGAMVDEITTRVMASLKTKKSPDLTPMTAAPAHPDLPKPSAPLQAPSQAEAVRRVNPVKIRSNSILGLELSSSDGEIPSIPSRPVSPVSRPSVPFARPGSIARPSNEPSPFTTTTRPLLEPRDVRPPAAEDPAPDSETPASDTPASDTK